MIKMMVVRCPKCKNQMKYAPRGNAKRKTCVYCGSSFAAIQKPKIRK